MWSGLEQQKYVEMLCGIGLCVVLRYTHRVYNKTDLPSLTFCQIFRFAVFGQDGDEECHVIKLYARESHVV